MINIILILSLFYFFSKISNARDIDFNERESVSASEYYSILSAYATESQAIFAKYQLYISLASLCFSIITTLYLILTYQRSKKNYEISEKNQEFANHISLKAITLSNRAWLSITPCTAKIYCDTDYCYIDITILIKNWGGSPATNVRMECDVKSTADEAASTVQNLISGYSGKVGNLGVGKAIFPSQEKEERIFKKIKFSDIRNIITTSNGDMGIIIRIKYGIGDNFVEYNTFGTYFLSNDKEGNQRFDLNTVAGELKPAFSGYLAPHKSGHGTS